MPLETRTNLRTGAELVGLILGAYALDRLGENTHLTIAVTNGVGFAWSCQGGSTLTKQRVHAISGVVMQVSLLSGVGRLVWELDEMQWLQRVRLVAGIGFMSSDTFRFAGHLWDGEWYACKRHECLISGRRVAIPEGAEGLPLDQLENVGEAERKKTISWWLKILNDDQTVDAMFATAGRGVSVEFWEGKLKQEQLDLAVEKAEVPELTDEQQKAVELIQGGEGDLQEAVALLRAEDGLWMKDRMWTVLEKMEGVTAPERRGYRDLVSKAYETLDVEEEHTVHDLFCFALVNAKQQYDHPEMLGALGLPAGKDGEAIYQRMRDIGLETEEEINAVIGETFEKTLNNVKALVSEKFDAQEVALAGKGLGHSGLDRVLIDGRPLVMGVLGCLAVGEMLVGSLGSEHGVWAFSGVFWGAQTDGGLGPLFDNVLCHQFLESTAALLAIDVVLRRVGPLGTAVVWGGLVALL